MRPMIFLCALTLVACSRVPSNQLATENAAPDTSAKERPVSFSPSAPIKLTYEVENVAVGQPQRVDLTISTRLKTGMLLVEVAKKEGADIFGDSTYQIDLSKTETPIHLQLKAMQLGEGEHFLVLLLTVETDMGPMSRSFRIDLTPAVTTEKR